MNLRVLSALRRQLKLQALLLALPVGGGCEAHTVASAGNLRAHDQALRLAPTGALSLSYFC